MKNIVSSLLVIGLAMSAQAVTKAELDKRLRMCALKLEEMQLKQDKRIPPDVLRKACGVILLQSARGGLVFGYEGGKGVVMLKEPNTSQWSAPAFLSTSSGSFGLQIGGQSSFSVVLLMNTNTARGLAEGDFKFGGEASGTAGNASGAEESGMSSVEPLMCTYTDASGLYGGAVVKGGALSPDTDADVAYYGEYVTVKEILYDGKAKPTEAATYLADKLNQYSK
jgi:SH3 domain-containing YSC84-like protein 1